MYKDDDNTHRRTVQVGTIRTLHGRGRLVIVADLPFFCHRHKQKHIDTTDGPHKMLCLQERFLNFLNNKQNHLVNQLTSLKSMSELSYSGTWPAPRTRSGSSFPLWSTRGPPKVVKVSLKTSIDGITVVSAGGT